MLDDRISVLDFYYFLLFPTARVYECRYVGNRNGLAARMHARTEALEVYQKG